MAPSAGNGNNPPHHISSSEMNESYGWNQQNGKVNELENLISDMSILYINKCEYIYLIKNFVGKSTSARVRSRKLRNFPEKIQQVWLQQCKHKINL